MKISRLALVASFGLAACEPAAKQENPPRDVRVQVPEVDAAWLDFATPEAVIPAGEERMFCSDLTYDGDDTGFSDVVALQGKYGHHVVLLSTKKPNTPGTIYDCTDIRTMANFEPFAIPVGNGLPDGYGIYLPKGKPIVVQMHYVNTSSQPILVRDVIRLKRRPLSEVTTYASVYANNVADFTVPPNSTGTRTFECSTPVDMKLLLLGGHMHESGTSFKLEIGPNANSLETLYNVDVWKADYRDEPPVNLYLTNPKPIAKGTLFRTTCTWTNMTDKAISFPEEMCTSFGLVAGPRDAVVCRIGEQ